MIGTKYGYNKGPTPYKTQQVGVLRPEQRGRGGPDISDFGFRISLGLAASIELHADLTRPDTHSTHISPCISHTTHTVAGMTACAYPLKPLARKNDTWLYDVFAFLRTNA